MTSVALITAVTLSPFFRPNSSALRFVITDSTRLSPTLTVIKAVTVPRSTSVISPLSPDDLKNRLRELLARATDMCGRFTMTRRDRTELAALLGVSEGELGDYVPRF